VIPCSINASGTPTAGTRIHGNVVIVEIPNSEAVIVPRLTAEVAGDTGGGESNSASGSDTAGQEDSGAAADFRSDSEGFVGGGFDSSGSSGMDFGGDFNF